MYHLKVKGDKRGNYKRCTGVKSRPYFTGKSIGKEVQS